jgi:hypothetical protein
VIDHGVVQSKKEIVFFLSTVSDSPHIVLIKSIIFIVIII